MWSATSSRVAPALAAERAGLRRATLIPHVYPVHEEGLPFFAFGALPARTGVGRALWRGALPVLVSGLERGRDEIQRVAGGDRAGADRAAARRDLARSWRWWRRFRSSSTRAAGPAHVHVTGPMGFELPYPDVELPPGDEPLVLVAPSTAQDPECRLVRAALEALADEPVRVLATTNRHLPAEPLPAAPANAVVVDWLSYTQAMAAADLVISHGGHGTVARALAAGVPAICCPAVGDMAENGARVAWSGTGLMLPWRLVGARVAADRGAQGAGRPGAGRRGRARSRPGRRRTTAPIGALELVEELARS